MRIGRSIQNIGSRASVAATAKAERIAIGAKPMRKVIHPGSAAGLDNAKPVYLQMNGSGYLNPANQTARYSKKSMKIPGVDILTSAGSMPRNRTYDLRTHGSSRGSVKLLRERI